MSQMPGATWCFPASRICAFTYDTLASRPTRSPLSCRLMNHSDRQASVLTPRPFQAGAEASWSHGQPLPMVASARFPNPTGVQRCLIPLALLSSIRWPLHFQDRRVPAGYSISLSLSFSTSIQDPRLLPSVRGLGILIFKFSETLPLN